MAASRWTCVGPPSPLIGALGIVVAAVVLLRVTPAAADRGSDRLTSAVRRDPLELAVAIEDSIYVSGQRTSVLLCVTNRGSVTIPFAPEPNVCGHSVVSIRLWTVAPGGAWFRVHGATSCGCGFIQSYAVPPISPLEPGGSTCFSTNLNTWYGTYLLRAPILDPSRGLAESALPPGRYALHVTYNAGNEPNPRDLQLRVDSDTLFFTVIPAITVPREKALVSGYAQAVDSCAGGTPCRRAVAARWLPRFSGARFFTDVLLYSGSAAADTTERMFSWADPYRAHSTRKALLADLLFRLSSAGQHRVSLLAGRPAFSPRSLAARVVEDWRMRPWRWSVRDSIYAERRKYLLRGVPPYGTWIDPRPGEDFP